MSERNVLTQDRLRAVLSYDPETGEFQWIERGKGRVLGRKAGGLSLGYVVIAIDGMRYRAHRLAWLYVHGYLPDQPIDHANCVKDDNRICNLRLATPFLNNGNVVSWNKTGFKGVSYRARRTSFKKWRAQIMVGGKAIYLGHYATPQEAHAAYAVAARAHFGEFARTDCNPS